jgi:pimeloyl-ACP methyl ester carboxylesterase
MWFNRHPLNNSLVVFVHGIFGDLWGTWRGVPAIIQSMAEHDVWVRSYDFYSFQYDSTAFHQPPLRPFAVDGLRQLLNKIQAKYETVVLIAHSQGGLLSKAFILEELMEGNGHSVKVDLLITLGTPHAGRKLLNPLHWLRKVPGVRTFGQLAQLAARSETIRFIRENWNDKHIMRQAGNPSSKRRHIRSVAVVGAYDIWAGSAGSEGYAVDVRHYLEKSHPALAKPRSEGEALSELIVGELRDHRRPDAALKEIREIRSDQEKMKQFIVRNGKSVAEIIKFNRTDLPLEGVQTKSATVMLDFLIDCPRRPMRCLPLDKMLHVYADRITGDWP